MSNKTISFSKTKKVSSFGINNANQSSSSLPLPLSSSLKDNVTLIDITSIPMSQINNLNYSTEEKVGEIEEKKIEPSIIFDATSLTFASSESSNYTLPKEKIERKVISFSNINAKQLENKYSVKLPSSLPKPAKVEIKNTKTIKSKVVVQVETSPIDDDYRLPKPMKTYVDDKENIHKLYTSMIDVKTKKCLPTSTTQCCYTDCHPFNWPPLFCPIKYHSSCYMYSIINQLTKESEIAKRTITEGEREKIEKFGSESDKRKIIKGGYYDGIHIFCSFNCVYTFLNKQDPKNSMFKLSSALIPKLYKFLFGKIPVDRILPAPDRAMLKIFGGPIETIEDYRKSFQQVEFFNNNQLENKYLFLIPNGVIFESNEILNVKKKMYNKYKQLEKDEIRSQLRLD